MVSTQNALTERTLNGGLCFGGICQSLEFFDGFHLRALLMNIPPEWGMATYHGHKMSHVCCNGRVHLLLCRRLNDLRRVLLKGQQRIRPILRYPGVFLLYLVSIGE